MSTHLHGLTCCNAVSSGTIEAMLQPALMHLVTVGMIIYLRHPTQVTVRIFLFRIEIFSFCSTISFILIIVFKGSFICFSRTGGIRTHALLFLKQLPLATGLQSRNLLSINISHGANYFLI